MLDKKLRRLLLDYARRAIELYLKEGVEYEPEQVPEELLQPCGAFVTIKVGGKLRGCIGFVEPIFPLYKSVIKAAISAATSDFRFPPLTLQELPYAHLEISVLSKPRPVRSIEEIEVGRHGIIISRGFNRGLLLPQVPLEYGWDLEEYLRHGCLKAGLEPDCWRRGDVSIEVFEAEVFGE